MKSPFCLFIYLELNRINVLRSTRIHTPWVCKDSSSARINISQTHKC